jgi:hypothetical protein
MSFDTFRCCKCREIVAGSEPCACVFNVTGAIDANGVLHTARRVCVGQPTAYACLSPAEMRKLDQELAQVSRLCAVSAQALWPIFEQIDAFGDAYATIFFDEDQIDLIVASTEWRPGAGWHSGSPVQFVDEDEARGAIDQWDGVEESHCYECGDNGSPRMCHDGVTRVLCVPCWYGHYMH